MESIEAVKANPGHPHGDTVAKNNSSAKQHGDLKVNESRSEGKAGASSYDPSSREQSEMDRFATLRREKRLAMNRESARLRRRRKKERIIALEAEVEKLARGKAQAEAIHELLITKVQLLEQQLVSAKSAVASLVRAQDQVQQDSTRLLSGQGLGGSDSLHSSESAFSAILGSQFGSPRCSHPLDLLGGSMPNGVARDPLLPRAPVESPVLGPGRIGSPRQASVLALPTQQKPSNNDGFQNPRGLTGMSKSPQALRDMLEQHQQKLINEFQQQYRFGY